MPAIKRVEVLCCE